MSYKYLFVVPHAATQTPLSKYGLAVGQLLTQLFSSRFPLLQLVTHVVPFSKYGLSPVQALTQLFPSAYFPTELHEATHVVPFKYGLSVGQLVTHVVPL